MNLNTFKTAIILAVLGGIFILIGGLLGGYTGLIIGLLIGFAITGASYWWSDKIALRAARAVPVSEAQMPEYYAVVRDLTTRAGMPMPSLYVTPDMQPNAFATGRSPKHAAVAVTQGILQICTWDEMRGVLAHELSHVRNRDVLTASVAAAVAMAITFIARLAAWASIFSGGNREGDGENIFEVLALLILAPIAAVLLQLALSRSREYQADASGAKLIGTGEPLASALAKLNVGAQQIPMPQARREMAPLYIVSPLGASRRVLTGLFSDHPPTAERIERLRSHSWGS